MTPCLQMKSWVKWKHACNFIWKVEYAIAFKLAFATPMQDEPNDVGETSNENNDDNFGFDW